MKRCIENRNTIESYWISKDNYKIQFNKVTTSSDLGHQKRTEIKIFMKMNSITKETLFTADDVEGVGMDVEGVGMDVGAAEVGVGMDVGAAEVFSAVSLQ